MVAAVKSHCQCDLFSVRQCLRLRTLRLDGNEGGQRDLLGAVEDRAHQRISLDSHVAMHVFDLHRGVVHQDADGQRQPTQRHDVERLAHGTHDDDGTEDRQRN